MAEATKIELPETPAGFTKRMTLHMSFEDGGIGSYVVHDPDGKEMPFGYGYDTRPGGGKGFTVDGAKGWLTWAQLRSHFAPVGAKGDV